VPEPGALETFARQADAVVRGNGPALDDVATTFASVGLLLFAAEASAQAAVAHERAHDGVARLAALRRVTALVDACGSPRTPAITVTPPALTDREREVAELAARGLSNRAIADRLYMSVRTVENHLSHVYDKLGVRGRDKLAAALDA
jgi:DNA-binding NarL/FixJ family response regulator